MSDQQTPEFDPEDPYREDRVRLRDAVAKLRNGHGDELTEDVLREIAERWPTYGKDLFTDHVADLARLEQARR